MMRYQICSNCVMDTSDTGIKFDHNGICDYCQNYFRKILPNWTENLNNKKKLNNKIDQIIKEGRGKKYNCIIGLSGGVDSSYVAYIAKEKFGLNPLLYHVDAGWNSNIAVSNIEKLVDYLKLDLYTEVIDWFEMRDLQNSYFKSGVAHLDTPQDHAFFAGLYNFAEKNDIKYVLTGANFSTECIREPLEWHYHASDLRQILDIQKRFGSLRLANYPMASVFKFKIYYRFFRGIKVFKPLNYIEFKKEDAINELNHKFGWQKYAHKHYESRFTKFCEGYWLPARFGFDKRRAHFSSLILTGQMTRLEAIEKLKISSYDNELHDSEMNYVANKLGISITQLNDYFNLPKKTFNDYKNSMFMINWGTKILRIFGIQRAVIR